MEDSSFQNNDLDRLETEHKLKVLTIKVECSNCGHIWGVKIDDHENKIYIPRRKFICTNCLV